LRVLHPGVLAPGAATGTRRLKPDKETRRPRPLPVLLVSLSPCLLVTHDYSVDHRPCVRLQRRRRGRGPGGVGGHGPGVARPPAPLPAPALPARVARTNPTGVYAGAGGYAASGPLARFAG